MGMAEGIEIGKGIERRRLLTVGVSIAVHCLLLAVLVREMAPVVLQPRLVMKGNRGSSMAVIDIPSDLVLPLLPEVHTALYAPPAKKQVAKIKLPTPKAREDSSGAALQAAHAGSPFGSQPNGLTTGHELKPALPVQGGRPRISASELPAGLQGDVIIEITISEQGKVIEKKVVKSIAPTVDGAFRANSR